MNRNITRTLLSFLFISFTYLSSAQVILTCQEAPISASGLDVNNPTATFNGPLTCQGSDPIDSVFIDLSVSGNCGSWYSHELRVNGNVVLAATCNLVRYDITQYLPISSIEVEGYDTDGWAAGDAMTITLTVNVDYAASCAPGTIDSLTGITTNSAVVNFTPGATNNGSVILQYGQSGFTLGLGNEVVATATASTAGTFTLTNLFANLPYDVYMRDVCSGDTTDFSGPVSFTTLTAGAAPAFFESFDGTSLPSGWTTNTIDGSGFAFTGSNQYDGSYGDFTDNGGNFAWVDFSSGPDTASLTTPLVDISSISNPVLSFAYNARDAGANPPNTMFIEYFDGTSFVTFETLNTPNLDWEELSYPLSNYTDGSGNVQIRFFMAGTQFYNDLAIDNVTITSAPNCPTPTVMATALSTNDARVEWDAPNADSVIYQWGLEGFAFGTGMEVREDSASTPSFLTPMAGQVYDVIAYSKCGTDISGLATDDFNTVDYSSCDLAYGISSLPFNLTGQTTNGKLDLYNDANACYTSLDDEEMVFEWTAGADGFIEVEITSASGSKAYAFTEGCPDTASCIETGLGSTTFGDDFIEVEAGKTYYIVVDQRTASTDGGFDIAVDWMPSDVELVAIANPSNPIQGGTEAVSVDLYNNSGLAVNAVRLGFAVNGVAQAPANITFPNGWNAGDDTTVNIGLFNFTTAPFTLDAYVINVNGAADADQTNDSASGDFCGPINGTFTLGGPTADFETWADLVAALDCGIDGPLTVNVNPGTYDEAVMFTEVAGASMMNPIVIDGGDADITTLTFDAGSSDLPTLYMNGADWFTIKNLTIEQQYNFDDAWSILLSNGANWNTIDNCIITMPVSTSSDRSNIAVTGSLTSVSTSANSANNLTITNNEITGGYYGISIRGASTSSYVKNFVIENNDIDARYYGIYSYYVDSMEVANNIIRQNETSTSISTTNYPIYAYYTSNSAFAGNDIQGNDYGLYTNTSFDNNLIQNNFIYAGADVGLYFSNGDNNEVYHNTIYSESGYGVYLTLSDFNDLRNNIITSGSARALYTLSSSTDNTIDYNLYHSSDISLYYESATYANLDSLKANTTENQNSVFGDPKFVSVNPANLDLTSLIGTIQNNSGTALGVARDFDNDIRNALNPDMGADEYTPQTVDLAFGAISAPASCYTANDTVSFEVINNASGTVDFAATALTINYMTSGALSAMGSEVINTGSLAAGDTLVIEVAGFDFSAVGVYDIDATIALTGDVVAGNDTASTLSIENVDRLMVMPMDTQFVTDNSTTINISAMSPEFNSYYQVGTGTSSSSYYPVFSNWGYTYTQQLYYPSDLNGAGDLHSISFYWTGSGQFPANQSDWVIYLGHTTDSTFASTTSWVPLSSLEMKFDGIVDINGSGWYEIKFDTPFAYDGTSNLVLAVEENAASYSSHSGFRTFTAGTNRGMYYRNDNNDPDPASPPTASSRTSYVNQILLDYGPIAPAFEWKTSGATYSRAVDTVAGPFTSSGIYEYEFELIATCGDTLSESVFVDVNIILSDASVADFLTSDVLCGDNWFYLDAEVCNEGSNIIYDIPVVAMVDGTMYTDTVDSILPLTCIDFRIDSIDASAGFVANAIDIYTDLSGDSDVSNDTLSVTNYEVFLPPLAPTVLFTDTVCSDEEFATFAVDVPNGITNTFYLNADKSGQSIVADTAQIDGITESTNIFFDASIPGVFVGGQFDITIDINWPSYASENTLEVYSENGVLLSSYGPQGSGNSSYSATETLSIPGPGNYYARALDSFGDSWNGAGSADLIVGGQIVASVTHSSGNVGSNFNFFAGLACASNLDSLTIETNELFIDSVIVTDASACGVQDGQIEVYHSGGGLGGDINASIDGGTSFLMGTSTTATLGRQIGGYDITLADDLCSVDGPNVNVVEPGAPAIPVAPMDVTQCFGQGSVTLSVVPDSGTTITWYADMALTMVLSTDSFLMATSTVGVTNYWLTQSYPTAGCESDAAMVSVENYPMAMLPDAGMDVTACLGDMVPLSIMGSNVIWTNADNGDTLMMNNTLMAWDSVGTYNYAVSYEDANGCRSGSDTVSVTRLTSPAAPVSNGDEVACDGDVIAPLMVFATGSNTVYWSSSMNLNDTVATGEMYTPMFNGPGYQEYYAYQVSLNGCVSPSTLVSSTVNSVPQGANLGMDVNYCQGDMIMPLSSGNIPGTTTEWYADAALTSSLGSSNSYTPANTVGSTTYYAVLSNGLCQSPVDSVVVTINAAPAIPTVTVAQDASCEGTALPVLEATGTGTLEWYSDTGLTNLVGTGNTYTAANIVDTVTYYVVDALNGCYGVGFDSAVAIIHPEVDFTVSVTDLTSCASGDGEIILTPTSGTAPFTYSLNGATAVTDSTFSALATGNYTPEVVDANGCSLTLSAVAVESPDQTGAPTDATTDPLSYCSGDALGFIKFTADSGTVNYYDDAALTNNIGTGDSIQVSNTIGASTYYVTAIFNGCESSPVTTTVTITQTPSSPMASADATYCFGDALMPMSVTGTGGTYSWYRDSVSMTSGFGSGLTRSPSPVPGVSTYLVTESLNGCEGSADTVVITINTLPAAPSVMNMTSCDYDVQMPLSVSGNGGALTWYTGANLNTVVAIGGTYQPDTTIGTRSFWITETDGNGCEGGSAKVDYVVNPNPVDPIIANVQDYCFDDMAMDLTVSNAGMNSFTWSSNDSPVSQVGDDLEIPTAAGTYTYSVELTNQFGCVSNFTEASVTVNALPVVDSLVITDVSGGCTDANGSIEFFVQGSGTFTYSGNGFTQGTNSLVSGLVAGPYSNLEVTDVNGCVSTPALFVEVAAPGQPLAPVLTFAQGSTCFNEVIGDITAMKSPLDSVAGGVFYWYSDAGLLTEIASNTTSLKADSVVGVTSYWAAIENNGCFGPSTRIDVEIFDLPTPSISASSDKYCEDNAIQTLSTFRAGSNTYTWYDDAALTSMFQMGSATVDVPTTTSGNYTYYVEEVNADGCSVVDSIDITIDALPAMTLTSFADICDNTDVTLTEGSGTGGGSGVYSGTNVSSAGVFSPSAGQIGDVTILYTHTTSEGCVDTISGVITVLEAPVVNATDTAFCFQEMATLTASGTGTSYLWADGTVGATLDTMPTSDANFSIDVTSSLANGCTETATANVIIHTLPVANATADRGICFGEEIVILASGVGVNGGYNWSNGLVGRAQRFPVVSDSTLELLVTDANGCQDVDTLEITVNALPEINVPNDTAICDFDTISVTLGTADLYTWNDFPGINLPSRDIAPSQTIQYVITAQEFTNFCVNSDTFTINVNPIIPVSAGNDVAICVGDSVELLATGGATLSWNTGAQGNSAIVNPSATTVYTVSSLDSNNCVRTDDVEVLVNALPVYNVTNDTAICIGESVMLVADGSDTYAWSTGASAGMITESPTATTIYSVTATDANNCQLATDVEVVVNDLPLVSAGADTVVCIGTSGNLTATGASTYTWNTGAQGAVLSVSPAVPTTYTVVGVDVNGCSNTDDVVVGVNALPTVTLADIDFCQGTSTMAMASGADTYSWSDGQTGATAVIDVSNVNAVGQGTITVTGTDANGCVNTATANITELALPTVNAGFDFSFCQGTTTTVTATGSAVSYVWSDNQIGNTITVSPAVTTDYTVVGTDVNGCTNSDVVNVAVIAAPPVNAGLDVEFCEGGSATLMASGATSYTWNNGTPTEMNNVNPTTTTVYTVTGTDGNNCSATDTVVVTVNALPMVMAGPDTAICEGVTVDLNAAGAISLSWNNGTQGSNTTVSPNATTVYTVTGTDGNGCVNTADVTVTVNTLPTVNFGSGIQVCEDSPAVPLTGATPAGGIFSGNGVVGTTFDPAVAGVGTVTITYTYTNPTTSCVNSASANVVVNALPAVSLVFANDICAGDLPYTLNEGTPAAGGIYSGTGVLGTNLFNPTAGAGTYTLTYTFTDAATSCSNDATADLTVNASPVVDLGPNVTLDGENTVTIDAGNAGATYSWSNGESTQTIDAAVTGNYSVTVTDGNGCSGSDVIFVSGESVGISINSAREISINYMPNPTDGYLQLQATNLIAGENLELRVMNMNGQMVYSERLSTADISLVREFDFSGLDAGMYIIQLSTETDTYTNRIIMR